MQKEDMIRSLRDEEALSLRPGIYELCGHKGNNHIGNHRIKALSLSKDERSHGEVLMLAKQYADDHDDIDGLTFSDHASGKCAGFKDPDTKRELWFHKEITIEGIRKKITQSERIRRRMTLYIK